MTSNNTSDTTFDEAWKILIARLISALEDILIGQSMSLSEYELIKTLSDPPYSLFDGEAMSGQLNLFQTHFVLFHALYLMRERHWQENNTWIDISPLKIFALSHSDKAPQQNTKSQTSIGQADPLQSYYLDLNHLTNTSEGDVARLLNQFWQAYLNPSQHKEALQTLGCESDTDWHTIKIQYRKLAMEHHPDRGGNAQTFAEIREAYEILKLYRAE
ncbi:hypothetical protein BTA51_21775 [Hahella sp. CCB-MM4]|uniref:DNA-J related domain-containing protein n=1 Tax=Hahella sp. (strain CCB-MM4) TaxID=1926491 RepID=UPI000B9B31FF|nr:DNA-J related domain-containing protein [Hahella sp. CCB-MM4]OZG71279.1 hypothetical protein BTA51_21775 [Hahella sp. CCB-MM4]